MCALQAAFAEENTIVSDHANRIAMDPRKAGHEGRAITGLEFVQLAGVDDARDDLAHIELLPRIAWHNTVQLARIVAWRARSQDVPRGVFPGRHVRHNAARDGQRVGIIFGVVIGDARDAGVHVRPAEVFGAHVFTGGGLDQRRPADEDRAGAFDDDRFVAHRGHVCAARGTRAHDHRHLGQAACRKVGLIEENSAKVLAIGKDIGLKRQKSATRVDEIDAR